MKSIRILKSNLIQSKHGFSTRCGGVSEGVYDSLNLGINRGDKDENVVKNWQIFLGELGMPDSFVHGKQVHENNVVIVDAKAMRGPFGDGIIYEADGYVTNVPGVPLAIYTADCVPVLLEDPVNKVIGAVHCGWRSTVADIEKAAIDKMLSLGADINEIRIAIGPAICANCFEVGSEVIEAVNSLIGDNDLYKAGEASGKYFLDLKAVVRKRAMMLGVRDEHIDIIKNCTLCEPKLFWSHRSVGMVRGSQANVICM